MFQKIDTVVARRVGDETILVPIRKQVGDLDSIYTLNEVGERVWSLIDGTNSVSSIVDQLCEEYEIDREVARRDVGELLDSMEQARLIVP